MNSKVADVFIHTKGPLNDRQFGELSKQVYRDQGIVSISRNSHRPSMLMVVYNTARTKSGRILETVRLMGYEASLVGI